MNTEVLVPNSQETQEDSQMTISTDPAGVAESKNSFVSAVDSIATPPSSQSPKLDAKEIAQPVEVIEDKATRVSPTRPYTPTLEVPRASHHGGDAHSSPSSRSSGSPSHGTKRTASGLMKRTNEASMASPASVGGRRESASSARIQELSKELKTRLTYAMVKVQNGWEKQSIDQVEAIVAQRSSPASAANGVTRNMWQSPREISANKNRRSRDFSQPMPARANMASLTASSPATTWSGYSNGTIPMYGKITNAGSSAAPRLAPPPELVSAPARADDRVSQSSSSSGQAQGSLAIKAVSHARTEALRSSTPTPQQEQEAADMLIAMSSPANSHYASPRRPEFAIPQPHHRPGPGYPIAPNRRPSFGGHRSTSSDGESSMTERQAKRRSFGYGQLQSDKDVDRILNQMADAAESDEEGVKLDASKSKVSVV